MTPEHGFWPPLVHVPVDETSGIPSRPTEQSENPQQDLFSESSLSGSGQLSPDFLESATSEIQTDSGQETEDWSPPLATGGQNEGREVGSSDRLGQSEPENSGCNTSLQSEAADISLQTQLDWRTIGRVDFNWRRDLSENGQKLYRLFLRSVVDKELLPIITAKQGIDLNEAINELKFHDVIDDSDAKIFRLK